MKYARDDETADKRRIETDFEDKFEKMQEEEDRQRKVISAKNLASFTKKENRSVKLTSACYHKNTEIICDCIFHGRFLPARAASCLDNSFA
jgi:hypothetical protein